MESFCISGNFQKCKSSGGDVNPTQCWLNVPAEAGLTLGPQQHAISVHLRCFRSQ